MEIDQSRPFNNKIRLWIKKEGKDKVYIEVPQGSVLQDVKKKLKEEKLFDSDKYSIDKIILLKDDQVISNDEIIDEFFNGTHFILKFQESNFLIFKKNIFFNSNNNKDSRKRNTKSIPIDNDNDNVLNPEKKAKKDESMNEVYLSNKRNDTNITQTTTSNEIKQSQISETNKKVITKSPFSNENTSEIIIDVNEELLIKVIKYYY